MTAFRSNALDSCARIVGVHMVHEDIVGPAVRVLCLMAVSDGA